MWKELTCCCLLLGGAISAHARELVEEENDLTRLSVEELAKLKVVTVSGRPESTFEAPGAVYVATGEDIRRSGATTLPDAMRLGPGLQASRIDADEWALAVRGFASRLSRSVLVLVDGRSVWTPLFAGVFWDAQDTLLEDVDQIEVRRGPGGAVYGANALNGVISVTSKSARDTHGGLVTLRAGSADQLAGLRWGGQRGADFHYRAYAKYAAHDGTRPVTPPGYDDQYDMGQGGFRLDWRSGERDRFTAQGDLYDGSSGQPTTVASFTPPFTTALVGDAAFRGRNVLGRFTHTFENAGELTAQAYYDGTNRHETYYGEDRDTGDLDLRHRFGWGGRHDTVWGLNYRRSRGRFEGVPTVQMDPASRIDDIAGIFANDEARFAHDRLRLSLGTKLEWNDYSGWNVQPSGHAAWVQGAHVFWGSVTRSLRTSSRVERDIVLYSSLSSTQPLFARASGTPDFAPESVLAYDAGYRLRVSHLLVNVSAFHNAYRDLARNVPGPPFTEEGVPPEPVRAVIPVTITNGPGGRASGIEAYVVVSASRSWRVQASYSFLEIALEGPANTGFKANSPRHQAWVASYLSPRKNVDVDVVFRAVGEISGQKVPAYTDLDARLAYRPIDRLELAVVGSNLLQSRRPEFGGGFEVERAGRLEAILHF